MPKRAPAKGTEKRLAEEPIEAPASRPRSFGWRFLDNIHAMPAEHAVTTAYARGTSVGQEESGTLTGMAKCLRFSAICQKRGDC